MEGKEVLALLDFMGRLQAKAKTLQKTLDEGELTVESKIKTRSEVEIYTNTGNELRILLEKLIGYKKEQFL